MDHSSRSKRNVNPRARANIVSRITFWFTTGLLWKTFRTNKLQEDDLYEVVHNYKAHKLGSDLEKHLEEDFKNHGSISIYRILWSCYGNEYLYLGLVQLFMRTVIVIFIPKSLLILVSYFKPGQEEITKSNAFVVAASLVFLNLVNVTYLQNYLFSLSALGIKVKTAFCYVMYRKCLTLSSTALSQITSGNIITLMTKDVGAFETIIFYANDVWIGFVQSAVVCYLIYQNMGMSALVGVGFFLLVMPFQIMIGKLTSKYRLEAGKRTDERIQVTQETLSAIKLIKMNAWETYFHKKISAFRNAEVNVIVKIFLSKTVVLLIGVLTSRIALYLLIMTYLWSGHTVSAELMYYLVTLFQRIRHALNVLIPKGITESAELYAAVQRIETLLKAVSLKSVIINSTNVSKEPLITFTNVTANVDGQELLRNITLSLKSGLTIISGRVGSGKTVLLKTILKDYPVQSGNLEVHGSISYASQEGWVFPSSLRQNIVFGEKFDPIRYKDVLRICALNQDIDTMNGGDNFIIGDKGINLSKGQKARVNLARAVYKDSDIYLFDDCLSSLDTYVQEYVFTECIRGFLKDKLCVFVTQNLKYVHMCDNLVFLDNGKITVFNIKENNNYAFVKKEMDIIVKEKNEVEEEDNQKIKLLPNSKIKNNLYKERKKSGSVNWDVYRSYIYSGGGMLMFLIIVLTFFLSHTCRSYSEKLISNWVNLEQIIAQNSTYSEDRNDLEKVRSAVILQFSIITLTSMVMSIVTACILFNFTRKASNGLHAIMISHVINALMQFFDTNFSANILNRFSKDFMVVDEQLPFMIFDFLEILFGLCGIITLIVSVNIVFLIPTAALLLILYAIRKVYMPSGRNLQRLDIAMRSPMLGYLNSSLDGLTTIRAFNAQKILAEEFSKHQDVCTSASYTSVCCVRAFALLLEVICNVFIAVIILKFLLHEKSTSVGDVGMALTQAFMLSGLVQYGIRQWADLENKMTSTERVLEYTKIIQEDRFVGKRLNDWPKTGSIVFDNVCLRYYDMEENVLTDISFVINDGEKIGIVGRTGAGKSSILSTLVRLYDYKGKIIVDNTDIKDLSLDFLRQQIIVIPQDPLLFSGTIRENIDPLGHHSDAEIWKTLEITKLTSVITALDTKITDAGSKLSAGERQLLCFARAIINKSKIIVLDEANANMDDHMDLMIMEEVKKLFSSSTVIVVAHRLQSVLGCDKIMVIDDGSIVEYDYSNKLLERNSRFLGMLKLAGHHK